MGLPTVIRPFPELILQIVDQTVVSVGPYMFQSELPRFNNSSTNLLGMASPPHRILRLLFPRHPASNNRRQVAGVACMTVGANLSKVSSKRLPSIAVSRPARMRRAPTVSGKYSSRAAMSNDMVVTAR